MRHQFAHVESAKEQYQSLSLHTRIGLLAAGLALTAIALLSVLANEYQRSTSITWAQRLNYELAKYIIDHQAQPLLQNDGTADMTVLKDLAMDIMMVNPSVELYLLSIDGRVLGHALDNAIIANPKIDTAPIQAFLKSKSIGFSNPIWGDDPRTLGAKGGFSAAAIESINREHKGYLYIILYGQISRSAADQLELDSRSTVWLSFMMLASFVGLMASYLAYRFLTRPLRTLIGKIVRNANLAGSTTSLKGDEIVILSTEFERLNQRIALQIEQLKQSDVQRRELIANLSHDMRTPLAGIQGYIELANQDSFASDNTKRPLATALRHCNVMSKRIDDLLMVAQLESNGFDLVAEKFSLKELIYDLTNGFQASAKKAGVDLRVVQSPGCESNFDFHGDISLLERLFANLIENAIGFTKPGGKVWIELTNAPTHYKIIVADTGCGMSVETQSNAFKRHWSSRSSTGLGLAIVERICLLYSIELHIQSSSEEPHRGTRFEITFPRGS